MLCNAKYTATQIMSSEPAATIPSQRAFSAALRKSSSSDGLIEPRQMYILVYVRLGGRPMRTAKVFKSGNSQAVRIPKEFHLEGNEVEIRRKGGSLVLRPKQQSWAALIDSLTKFTDDFMDEGRRQPPVQHRGRAFS